MTTIRRKGFAYITHGCRLLVFTHPEAPEAGIQVPAGTLHDGEDVVVGTMREAEEETGLHGLQFGSVLGVHRYDARPFGRDELHDRTFVHLVLDGDARETWLHGESDPDGAAGGDGIPFAFFWAELPNGVPDLIADHDRFVPALVRSLDANPTQ